MKIDIKTRIPLESGKVYYGCEGNDEYIYKPCSICDGTGKIEIKKNSFLCPECKGKNSRTYEVEDHKIRWKVAKYYLQNLSFDKDGNIISARLEGINADSQYLRSSGSRTSLIDMVIFTGELYDNYGDALREVKKRNKEEQKR